MGKDKEIPMSTHHIVPRSMGGSNDKINRIELRDTTHKALHTLFQNRLIAEQLITTIDLSRKALRPEVRERLLDVLTEHDAYDLDFWYKPKTH